MGFMDWIVEELENVSDWFYVAQKTVEDWVWPFYLLEEPLFALFVTFHWLALAFEDFNEWVEDAADKLRDILDFGDIWSYFRTWFDWAEDAWYWVRYARDNIIDIVADWWAGILPYILTYVDNAVEGVTGLIEGWDTFWTVTFPEWTSKLDDLKASWDTFWTVTLPTLLTFEWLSTWWGGKLMEIDTLINSWFLTFTPFWEGWQDWKGQVTEFFSDPYQWIYDRLDEFFERFW